jgi:hypothetical protein
LIARGDPNAYLLLAGLPDEFVPLIGRLSEDVRDRVRQVPLTDSDRELSVMYSSMDCFLHAATIGESFGLVLTEAMLCGCPVVTVARPDRDNSHVEVVGHLKAGLVAASMRDFPRAALALWEDDALRRRLGAGARQNVIDRYGSDQVAALAVRVAAITLECGDRAELVRRLAATPGLQTDATDQEAERQLRDAIGRPRAIERLRMRLVNTSAGQRMIRLMKHRT